MRTNSLSRLGEASRENDPSFAGQCGWEKYREHLEMAQMQDEQGGGAPLTAEGKSEAEVKLILYHWTHSFSSQKVKASAGRRRAERIGFQHQDSSLGAWPALAPLETGLPTKAPSRAGVGLSGGQGASA